MKFCFVILDYNTENESICCVSSIYKCCHNKDVAIILVNNCPQNKLDRVSAEYPDVYIINSEYNLGFAKGNNVGFTVAKHTINADCIIIMNSDTILCQNDFLDKIELLYKKYSFSILGPDIVTLNGQHQNPAFNVLKTKGAIRKAVLINALRYIKYTFVSKKKQNGAPIGNRFIDEDVVDNPLHGACLIFSKSFIDRHECAFYPDTFMYGEEEFLYYNAQKFKELLLYSPEIRIIHTEDAATNHTYRDYSVKQRFKCKRSIESLKKLLKYID